MTLVSSTPCSSPPQFPISDRYPWRTSTPCCLTISMATSSRRLHLRCRPISAVCTENQTIPPCTIDHSTVSVAEAFAEDQLWAAACLRVRSFYDFQTASFCVEVSTLSTLNSFYSFKKKGK